MDIMQFILSVIDKGQLQVLAYMIAANLILGLVAALKDGGFELARIKDFWRRVGVVFGSYLVVAIAAKGLADFEALRTVAWYALIAFMATQIVGNLKSFGLPIPDGLQKWIER